MPGGHGDALQDAGLPPGRLDSSEDGLRKALGQNCTRPPWGRWCISALM